MPHPAPWLRGAFDDAQGEQDAIEECPPRPGITTFNDFADLVARTRQTEAERRADGTSALPDCYGGGVTGTGDVDGPNGATDDNLAAFDGTTGKLIDDSGIAKDTVMTTARAQSLTPDPADVLGMATAGGPPLVVAISDVNAILDHNIQTNLAVGDVHTQYAKDSGTPGSTGFVPVYTADRQIAPSGVGIPDGAGGQNLEVPGLISAPTGLVGTEQASSPHGTAAGQGTFYVRNTLPSKPAFEGDTGVDELILLAGDIGVSVQAFDQDLTAIAALAGTGYAVRTAANTWAQRAFTASSEITITNPSGIAGDTLLNITANGITDTMLRDSSALSVIGRSANSTGDPADIAAGTDHQVLRRSGTSLGFGSVNLGQSAAVTGTLPITNGGTGQITAAAAFDALKQAASDSATGVIEIAVQSEMESASSTTLTVTPGRQHFHPGHPKCWAFVNDADGTPTLAASYNITSITDNGAGLLTVTIATDFSSASWCCLVTCENPSANPNEAYTCQVKNGTKAAGSVQLTVHAVDTDTLQDPESYAMAGFGDQA